MHGGLSQKISELKQIEALDNRENLDLENSLCDLFWSDPNPNPFAEKWELSFRGLGYFFSITALREFLKNNDLKLLIRSHERSPSGRVNKVLS